LRAPDLVAAADHGRAGREEQRREEVPQLARAERADLGVLRLPLDAAAPREVLVRPVLVVLAVRLVVLLLVRHEIPQREAVGRGDEVHARVGPASVALVEVRAPREAIAEIAHAPAVAAPEAAHGVAVLAVPLRPAHREPADLVAAVADVPRLGDELHAA